MLLCLDIGLLEVAIRMLLACCYGVVRVFKLLLRGYNVVMRELFIVVTGC